MKSSRTTMIVWEKHLLFLWSLHSIFPQACRRQLRCGGTARAAAFTVIREFLQYCQLLSIEFYDTFLAVVEKPAYMLLNRWKMGSVHIWYFMLEQHMQILWCVARYMEAFWLEYTSGLIALIHANLDQKANRTQNLKLFITKRQAFHTVWNYRKHGI